MFALKVLSGSNAGHMYPFSSNEMIIGRSPECEISIPNKNISKKHAKIILDKNRVLFTDLNSTNGSFINGIKVEVTLINLGDKISLYDTILEVVEDQTPLALGGDAPANNMSDDSEIDITYGSPLDKALHKADQYLTKAAMPPFHLLAEKIDFKWIIGLFLFLVIVATALLSTIPLMSIIQDTVELESKRRASSLAKSLAMSNTKALQSGTISGASVEFAYREPGVKKAYIIRQSNGEIVSPSIYSGQFTKNPLVHRARKMTERPNHVFKIGNSTIVAMHPVKFYSQRDSAELTKFYTVVIYNAEVLSMGNEKTLSLFTQTLFLSLIFGVIIFFFLYKIIEHPFSKLLKDLKVSLRTNDLSVLESKILFGPLKEIYVIVASLVNRSHDSSSNQPSTAVEADRTLEVQNLLEMLGYASIIISEQEQSILDYNPLFEELTNLYDIKGLRLSELTDQALQQNLIDLVNRSSMEVDQIVTNDFEFSGVPYDVRMHPILGTNGVAYFVCSFFPSEVE